MSYNIAKYVIGWRFNDLHDGVQKLAFLGPAICSQNIIAQHIVPTVELIFRIGQGQIYIR